MKTVITKELLETLYLSQRLSTHQIASRTGWSQAHIRRVLKRLGIPTRNYKSAGRETCAASRRTGHGKITGSYWSNVRGSARRRDISFDVSIQFAWELFLSQGCRCALTGVPLTFSKDCEEHRIGVGTASLDRKDSSGDYTPENVQWVHKDINIMKREFDQDRFVHWCRLVSSHLIRSVPSTN